MAAHKVMLLGEIGVGKSSLARRLVFDKFSRDYKPTIGVEVYRYDVPADPASPATSLILWDTDGNFGDAISGTSISNKRLARSLSPISRGRIP